MHNIYICITHVILSAVLSTRGARIIAIFPAGKRYQFEAQTNDYHLQHIFQVFINLHGQKCIRKHPHRLVLF